MMPGVQTAPLTERRPDGPFRRATVRLQVGKRTVATTTNPSGPRPAQPLKNPCGLSTAATVLNLHGRILPRTMKNRVWPGRTMKTMMLSELSTAETWTSPRERSLAQTQMNPRERTPEARGKHRHGHNLSMTQRSQHGRRPGETQMHQGVRSLQQTAPTLFVPNCEGTLRNQGEHIRQPTERHLSVLCQRGRKQLLIVHIP
mmetsp:Transcript_69106/g.156683  ORF Transcript_69106/g.156683 Transcript_69106/m.156683 type:complete len:201 (-) Transcript_69106:387-989(-)